jgi:hypothetical protein
MLKKLIVASAAGLLLMGFLFGREATSYVRTSVGCVKDTVKESVPVKFQIERARKMIDGIQPDVYRNKSLIVREEVAIEQLASRIENLENRQADAKAKILKMKGDLDTGQAHIYYAGQRYSAEQVNLDLSNRFRRFKTQDEELHHLKAELAARQKTLTVAREKLEKMLIARDQLIADIAKLEAQEKMIQVAKASSELSEQVDDSQLARTMELVQDISARLEVENRMLDSDVEFVVQIPVDEEPPAKNLSDEIANYFSGEVAPTTLAAEVQIEIDGQL